MSVATINSASPFRAKFPAGLLWSITCVCGTALIAVFASFISFTGEKEAARSIAAASKKTIEIPQIAVTGQAIAQVASIIRSSGRKLSAVEVRELATAIVEESVAHDIDPLFVAAVAKAESTFNHQAISNRGARGLLQIMPATGEYISAKLSLAWNGYEQLHDPRYNLKLGIGYLKYLNRVFKGNVRNILVAYNWGPGNLRIALKNGSTPPQVSRKYAEQIIANYERWKSSQVLVLAQGAGFGKNAPALG